MADLKAILKPVPLESQGVCATCRFFKKDGRGLYSTMNVCLAVSRPAFIARQEECRSGRLWEAKPAFVPVLIRLKRWLVG